MQEIVQLSLSLRRPQNRIARLTDESSGMTFCRFILFLAEEDVTTDRLLVSEEAVRCLNAPLR